MDSFVNYGLVMTFRTFIKVTTLITSLSVCFTPMVAIGADTDGDTIDDSPWMTFIVCAATGEM